MEIKQRKTAEIVAMAAAYNPRHITEEQMDALCESIKRFGFVVPVLINTLTDTIVSGHQRVKAAVKLGLEEVPVIEMHVDAAGEKILNIGMNRIKGKFDAEKLSAIFSELVKSGDDVEITGFSRLEVAELGALLGEKKADTAKTSLFVIKLDHTDKKIVQEALRLCKALEKHQDGKFNGAANANSNGNAISRIAEEYIKTNGQSAAV